MTMNRAQEMYADSAQSSPKAADSGRSSRRTPPNHVRGSFVGGSFMDIHKTFGQMAKSVFIGIHDTAYFRWPIPSSNVGRPEAGALLPGAGHCICRKMKGACSLRGMSEKHWDRHRMEHGKHEPQGHGEALDREQHGHSKADLPAKERNDHPDDRGHAHDKQHTDHRSEEG